MEFLYCHENVHFRRVDKQDIQALLDLKNESWFGTHTITLANSITQEKWLEKISEDTHCPRNLVLVGHLMVAKAANDFGIFKILNIDWQNRKAEVGWDVYKSHRRKGLGKQLVKAGVSFCFNILNLRRLDAQILQDNEASIICAKHAGFALEGVQKKAIFKNGDYVDNVLFGVLNAQYRN